MYCLSQSAPLIGQRRLDSQYFLWDINDREDRKVAGLSVWLMLPFALRFANSDAAVEITVDAAEIAYEVRLQVLDLGADAPMANAMPLLLWERHERPLVSTDLPTQSPDPMNAWHGPIGVPRTPIEPAAATARDLGDVQVLTPAATGGTRTAAVELPRPGPRRRDDR
jgi:hypothetical protein